MAFVGDVVLLAKKERTSNRLSDSTCVKLILHRRILRMGEQMERVRRYRGSLLGLATGDALGTTLEFKPPGSFKAIRDILD